MGMSWTRVQDRATTTAEMTTALMVMTRTPRMLKVGLDASLERKMRIIEWQLERTVPEHFDRN